MEGEPYKLQMYRRVHSYSSHFTKSDHPISFFHPWSEFTKEPRKVAICRRFALWKFYLCGCDIKNDPNIQWGIVLWYHSLQIPSVFVVGFKAFVCLFSWFHLLLKCLGLQYKLKCYYWKSLRYIGNTYQDAVAIGETSKTVDIIVINRTLVNFV